MSIHEALVWDLAAAFQSRNCKRNGVGPLAWLSPYFRIAKPSAAPIRQAAASIEKTGAVSPDRSIVPPMKDCPKPEPSATISPRIP